MSCEPLQNIDEPSAVSRRIPSTEEDLGPGKTETEAPELTRNWRHSHHVYCDTSRIGKKLKIWRAELESENGRESGFESENVWAGDSWRSRSGEEPWHG